ncbi:retron Ec67 family RNA-directed DNA polymerase/endonuclease [Weissella paramesenteroides]|uniref:retron Ec67 family RNA-directed DNA polymerase/endonuclease n=1 Tax=Weissella paramesenteroides TaxID=1249 RepID=UPI0013D91D55|nr:retron Ec67 family RNA-directed DNA polymerase/endonuclease [Weissella paramesenteroides]NEZ89063.1 RNA-directed DNA polymerase [Weissella paramesenteroides]NFB03388.1 RNA-directed DNA polymerase [Weissella paramesenteroides]
MAKKLSDITNKNQLIQVLIVAHAITNGKTFYNVLNNIDKHYTEFSIPKKYSNELRTINAPDSELKKIQKQIKRLIENQLLSKKYYFNISSQAYQKNKSIFTNAQIHRNKKYILHFDIENFFDNITFRRINGFFQKNKRFKLPYNISTILTRLCCCKGHLVQGSPISPIISNLIGDGLDYKLRKLSNKYHFIYTRYADDMIFSTNDSKIITNKLQEFMKDLQDIIEQEGFSLNQRKYTLMGPNVRHYVTGLTNNKKVATPIEFYKSTRAMANHLYKYGEINVNGKIFDSNSYPSPVNIVEGRLNHIYHIEQENRKLYQEHSAGFEYFPITPLDYQKHTNKLKINNDTGSIINELSGKELEYSKFIFYKNFFYGDYIKVFTEGKTDPRYIKKAYSMLRPNDNSIRLSSVESLLNHNNILTKVFNLHQGGDGLTDIFNMYTGNQSNENKYFNYTQYFNLKTLPIRPTIILMDFELNNKNKTSPLNNFINNIVNTLLGGKGRNKEKERNKIKQELKEKGYYRIYSNLYLAVTTDLIEITSHTENKTIDRDIENYFDIDLVKDMFQRNMIHIKDIRSVCKVSELINKNEFSKSIKKINDATKFTGFQNLITIFSNIHLDYLELVLNKLLLTRDNPLIYTQTIKKIKSSNYIIHMITGNQKLNNLYKQLNL